MDSASMSTECEGQIYTAQKNTDFLRGGCFDHRPPATNAHNLTLVTNTLSYEIS